MTLSSFLRQTFFAALAGAALLPSLGGEAVAQSTLPAEAPYAVAVDPVERRKVADIQVYDFCLASQNVDAATRASRLATFASGQGLTVERYRALLGSVVALPDYLADLVEASLAQPCVKPAERAAAIALAATLECMQRLGRPDTEQDERMNRYLGEVGMTAERFEQLRVAFADDTDFQTRVQSALASCPQPTEVTNPPPERNPPPTPSSRYRGSLRGGRLTGTVAFQLRGRSMSDPTILIGGRPYRATARVSGNTVNITGRSGPDLVRFVGRIGGGSVTGSWSGRVGGRNVGGTWRAGAR